MINEDERFAISEEVKKQILKEVISFPAQEFQKLRHSITQEVTQEISSQLSTEGVREIIKNIIETEISNHIKPIIEKVVAEVLEKLKHTVHEDLERTKKILYSMDSEIQHYSMQNGLSDHAENLLISYLEQKKSNEVKIMLGYEEELI